MYGFLLEYEHDIFGDLATAHWLFPHKITHDRLKSFGPKKAAGEILDFVKSVMDGTPKPKDIFGTDDVDAVQKILESSYPDGRESYHGLVIRPIVELTDNEPYMYEVITDG